MDHLEAILAVNQSLPERQGKPLADSYLEIEALRSFFEPRREFFAVFDPEGALKAYADVPIVGEVAILSRVLGHGEALDSRVMYLCISEVVREMIQRRSESGDPKWVLYDTLVGGSTGLRRFKRKMGFRACNVRWVWESRPGSGVAA
jgi:hypothetical protein